MAVRGAASMTAFARDRSIPVETTGKLVVATSQEEVGGLRRLAGRATANGVPARLVSPAEAREYEPYVSCVEALRVETTGIVDYGQVCLAYADDVVAGGGLVRTGTAFAGIETSDPAGVRVRTTAGDTLTADALVVCAGLHADVLARACGVVPDARIVPFRGEYFELAAHREHVVRGLLYPVPDPRFPFLGVHLTRTVHGGVHVGPNAVLALRREGYTWRGRGPRRAGRRPVLARTVAPRRPARGTRRSRGGAVPVADGVRSERRPAGPRVSPRGTSGPHRPASGPRRSAGTARWWTTSSCRRRRGRCTSSTRRRRRPPPRWRSPTTSSARWTPSPARACLRVSGSPRSIGAKRRTSWGD